MTCSILLVGENNPYSRDPDDALLPWPANAAGDRMRRILGMSQDDYLAAFSRANLLATARWSMREAVASACVLFKQVRPQLIVSLGARTTGAFVRAFDRAGLNAFGYVELTYPEPIDSTPVGAVLLHLPHPSGRNRMWEVPGSTQKARDAFKNACKLAGVTPAKAAVVDAVQ